MAAVTESALPEYVLTMVDRYVGLQTVRLRVYLTSLPREREQTVTVSIVRKPQRGTPLQNFDTVIINNNTFDQSGLMTFVRNYLPLTENDNKTAFLDMFTSSFPLVLEKESKLPDGISRFFDFRFGTQEVLPLANDESYVSVFFQQYQGAKTASLHFDTFTPGKLFAEIFMGRDNAARVQATVGQSTDPFFVDFEVEGIPTMKDVENALSKHTPGWICVGVYSNEDASIVYFSLEFLGVDESSSDDEAPPAYDDLTPAYDELGRRICPDCRSLLDTDLLH